METPVEPRPAVTLPFLLNYSPGLCLPHEPTGKHDGLNWDLEFLDVLLALLRARCGGIPTKAARHIYKFDVIIPLCNAVVVPSGPDFEIGFFTGLRDCLFETSNLVFSHGGFMPDLLGESSSKPVSFRSPLPGFENYLAFDENGFPFVPPLPPGPESYPRPVDKVRLLCTQFFRLCAEELVWLHEYAHVYRGHFLMLQHMAANESALAEGPAVTPPEPMDGSTALVRRVLEHDADWQAFLTLVEHIGQGEERKYAGAIAMLAAAQEMAYSIFWISQIIAGVHVSETHPHPFARSTAIGREVLRQFGGDSEEMQMFLYGVREWRKASSWLGWAQFIQRHGAIAVDKDDLLTYFGQVDHILAIVDRICEQPSRNWDLV